MPSQTTWISGHGSRKSRRFYLFYTGGYNNAPQQIGHAVSDDGLHWRRTSAEPFLPNGKPGAWNSSASGHPFVFVDGERTQLFFQGNNDNGQTWHLSRVEIGWDAQGQPFILDAGKVDLEQFSKFL